MIQLHNMTLPDLIKFEQEYTDKEYALKHMIEHGYTHDLLDNKDAFLKVLMDRENLNSTGIGEGIAIPHARYSGIPKLMFAISFLREAIEFDSIDGKPVRLIIMFFIPEEAGSSYTKVLAAFSRFLSVPANRSGLMNAMNPEEVLHMLEEFDNK